MACAITAKKLCLSVAHLEAGLRSGDMSMPEEINRIVTDRLSDVLWTHSPDANKNLYREGTEKEQVTLVGNIMIDSYEMLRERIKSRKTACRFGLKRGSYGVVTLHRPANVDCRDNLKKFVSSISAVSEILPLIFPVHPRTSQRLNKFGLDKILQEKARINLTRPLGYIDFMSLMQDAKLVITDSGGMQEETTYLNVPCLTLRENTERPITITQGTNRLASFAQLRKQVSVIINKKQVKARRPKYWDGHTAKRVVESIKRAIKI